MPRFTSTPLMLYQFATAALSPLMPFYLAKRQRRGKEDAARLPERFGVAMLPRPAGSLLWVHAASVGEANSALPLMEEIKRAVPEQNILLTTGTVTSARLMQQRLPKGVIHQFVPIDTPLAVARFLAHWQPNLALMVESELWPNLLSQTRKMGCRMVLVNARMSESSFHSWRRFSGMAKELLSSFTDIFAQSEEDAVRYRALGAENVSCLGNLKYDGMPLPADADMLVELEAARAGRPAWLAASIHPGEDAMVAETHLAIKARHTRLLTVVVPRHPEKGAAMAGVFKAAGLNTSLRSAEEYIAPETDVYIADTLGELGLFYRAFPLCFIGGSLIAHGGQNPLEAARLGCTILFGHHMENFADISAGLLSAGAAQQVDSAPALAEALFKFLDPAHGAHLRAAYASHASTWMIGKSGVNARLLSALLPMLSPRVANAA
jgi:3-deoxy-D-manno-octulosonic-acid transferase